MNRIVDGLSGQVSDGARPARAIDASKSSRIPMRFAATCVDRLLAAVETTRGNPFCCQIVVRLSSRLDERLLASAVRATLEIHPHLACRFVPREIRPYWIRNPRFEIGSVFGVIERTDEKRALQEVLAVPLDPIHGCAVRVILLRTEVDSLCVKLDHKMGDGYAAKEYAYLLAATYRRLQSDPAYVPALQYLGDRSFAQLVHAFPRDQQRRVLRTRKSPSREVRSVNRWHLPPARASADAESSSEFLVERISIEVHDAIFRYAFSCKATVNHVLLACFCRAAVATIPSTNSQKSTVLHTVDLRRHLPGKKTSVPCNLSGLVEIQIPHIADAPLDHFVTTIRDQMYELREKMMGFPHRMVRLDTLPLHRFAFGLLPTSLLTRIALKRLHPDYRRSELPARLVMSNVGVLDYESLSFGNAEAVDAFGVSGAIRLQNLLLLSVTEFRRALAVTVGFSPRVVDAECIQSFMQAMIKNLPQ